MPMIEGRRNFFKKSGVFLFLLGFRGPLAFARTEDATSPADTAAGCDDVDLSLKFMNRDAGPLPSSTQGYISSFHKATFLLQEAQATNGTATFRIQPSDGGSVKLETFSMRPDRGGTVFKSSDGKYLFLWKSGFGFYALASEDPLRFLELCPPVGGNLPYYPDNDIRIHLDSAEDFYAHWIRSSFWKEGAPRSPLAGFEGFGEETLWFDSSTERDEKIGRAFDRFLNSIPFGFAALKTLAVTVPAGATRLVEMLIPRVFGWMIGPTRKIESGKILIENCPYRKRMGTYPCEATCGHAIAKYFTEQVHIPVRFDPTVENYTKCHILIGRDQCSRNT